MVTNTPARLFRVLIVFDYVDHRMYIHFIIYFVSQYLLICVTKPEFLFNFLLFGQHKICAYISMLMFVKLMKQMYMLSLFLKNYLLKSKYNIFNLEYLLETFLFIPTFIYEIITNN